MTQHEELLKMFQLRQVETNAQVADNIGLELDDFIDVELPSPRPKKKSKYKPRGKAFEKGEFNYNSVRWVCLQCGLESNIGGIGNHQKKSGHVGKQRVFRELEKLGII